MQGPIDSNGLGMHLQLPERVFWYIAPDLLHLLKSADGKKFEDLVVEGKSGPARHFGFKNYTELYSNPDLINEQF